MNLHPIERAALAAARPCAAQLSEASRVRESLVQQCAALARHLADVLLANVQNTTSLNLSAARALLAHAHIPTPANLQQRSDTWRHSWRSFEICATSADQVIGLTRGHVERSTAALWRAAERSIDDAQQLDHARAVALREVFDTMRAAQAGYWQATQRMHDALLAAVQTPLSVHAEQTHGTH